MPSNLMFADTMFPRLQEGEDPGSAIKRTNNYLFMLVEQLRYSFHNLELANFNNAALDSLKEIITDPIYASIQDTNGNLAELALTAEGLSSRIKDTEGNISTLTQTANSLQSQIKDANGSISAVSQTANKINWLVASGTSAADFTMTDRAATLVAEKIDLTGFVTFKSLSTSGESSIDGGNIKASSIISAPIIDGGEIRGATFYGNQFNVNGSIWPIGDGTFFRVQGGQFGNEYAAKFSSPMGVDGIFDFSSTKILGSVNVTMALSDGSIAVKLDKTNGYIKFWVDNTAWILDADGLHQ